MDHPMPMVKHHMWKEVMVIKMDNPTHHLKFKYSWRPYQQRVLDAIQDHLSDQKLHLIAPPGSGKTSLGLEIFKRLGKPALALSPTRVIRDQWINRLGDFLPRESSWPLTWVSKDLIAPSFFMSITYQALHSKGRFGGHENEIPGAPGANRISELAKLLCDQGVKTVILDECHHLKAAWWKSLTRLVEEIPGVTVVSLTATPPLDGKHFEWRKYLDLCGPIDEEIGVPELVKAKTLCPHQDFIWAVNLPEDHHRDLEKFAAVIGEFIQVMDADLIFFDHMLQHPWRLDSSKGSLSDMLHFPELVYAVIIYWRAKGITMPGFVKEWLERSEKPLPEMDVSRWQTLLRGYLFLKEWPHTLASKKHRDTLAKQLRSKGLLYQRELRLVEAKPMKRLLSLSSAKLEACLEIYRVEHHERGTALRQVFLTDYIRDETDITEIGALAAGLGAWPLFYHLAANVPSKEQKHMALLTGRKSAIHRDWWPLWLGETGLNQEAVPMVEHPHFVHLQGTSSKISEVLTRWLTSGRIKVLVGTRSLLGEGWDAPCVNSLVLASFIGSYVATNQMRGRAIRINPESTSKWASIWHLVTVDDCPTLGMLDFEDLERRFHTFAGLDADQSKIENSLARMRLPFFNGGKFIPNELKVQDLNELMVTRYLKGHHLAEAWQNAIDNAEDGRMVPSVSTDRTPGFRGVYLRMVYKESWFSGLWLLGILGTVGTAHVVFNSLLATTILTFVGAKLFLEVSEADDRLIYSYNKLQQLGTPGGLISQIGKALRDALCAAGHLKMPQKNYRIRMSVEEKDRVFVALVGGDFYEQSLFADCMETLVKAPVNPRYLLIMKEPFWGKSTGQTCYAVPKILGTKKNFAAQLHASWIKHVGKAELKFTRLDEGKELLLEAQVQALTSVADASRTRIDRWM